MSAPRLKPLRGRGSLAQRARRRRRDVRVPRQQRRADGMHLFNYPRVGNVCEAAPGREMSLNGGHQHHVRVPRFGVGMRNGARTNMEPR